MAEPLSAKRICITKRSVPQQLMCYVFIMPFLLALLQEFLGLPTLVKYTLDVAWITVFAILFIRSKISLKRKILPFAILIGLWVLYTLVGYVFHFQSVFYYLWGFRNNFRFYLAFLAFSILFNRRDADGFLKLLNLLFWLNMAVTLMQFFVLGYDQDRLGGIFGVERGCNAYSIIFYSVVISKSILACLNGNENTFLCLIKCGIALFLSALAEIKVFFVIFLVIFSMAAVFTKFSWRKFLMLFVAAVLFMEASSVLTMLFGENSNISINRILDSFTSMNYATAEDLGRFTAIPIISNRILTDLPSRLFGLGLGNCDTSAFAICNTPFYNAYASLHYTWISSAFLFLETGYLGLISYLSFFVISFFLAWKQMNKNDGNIHHCQIAMIMSVLCIVLTFYNSSLRMEVGYVAYFALALPYMDRYIA